MAVEVEGHKAHQVLNTSAADEDGRDDGAMEVADLSSFERAASMASSQRGRMSHGRCR